MTKSTDTLDDLFGRLLPPENLGGIPPDEVVSEPELRQVPQSRTRLDDKSGQQLKAVMDRVKAGPKPVQLLFKLVPVLWLVDAEGAIYFAVEEVVDEGDAQLKAVLSKGAKESPGTKKLGHPSLIKGRDKWARIAGEIYFTYGEDYPVWEITNQSGRYGIREGLRDVHLKNVAKEFSRFGVRPLRHRFSKEPQ